MDFETTSLSLFFLKSGFSVGIRNTSLKLHSLFCFYYYTAAKNTALLLNCELRTLKLFEIEK